MNKFEEMLQEKYFSSEQFKVIQSAKVGIAGAGGLGSNIANILVRTGFKYFEIVDCDEVEISNLNRQQYFLADIGQPKVEVLKKHLFKINPDIDIKALQVKVTKDNIKEYFKDVDIIFEAFDTVESKKLVLEDFGNSGKLVISGNGMAGIKNKEWKIKKLGDNCFIVGDQESSVDLEKPYSPRVTACAALMASIALEKVSCG